LIETACDHFGIFSKLDPLMSGLMSSHWNSIAFFAVILTFAGASLADSAEDLATGYDAYSQGNYTEASDWFHKAAKQGSVTAQDSLGVMYVNGEGVQRDYVLAFMWFEIAIENVPQSDPHWRSRLAEFMAEIAVQMTPEQISEAQRRAQNWTFN
jgi:TPR repeat protein